MVKPSRINPGAVLLLALDLSGRPAEATKHRIRMVSLVQVLKDGV
jgi:hypothetical protein